ncbi:hypothetical protein AK830_g3532 [Neonectria ditissima]|uniref:BZIP domain-containing protein n=1 Tax=Neonectria ditissima TaxID=78410 RepID=A0A0P7AYI1_9HYPO|nr:hypothetical protein AK830_g3532 [Neonectria ditissima]
MDSPDHSQTAPQGSSKKRSRTVSNLTDEQVQHKRNVDRRAQRAFRQRTKDCIVNLEQQFSQLQETAYHREQELIAVRQQNKSLTDHLEAILDLVSTALSHSREVARPSEGAESDSGLHQEPDLQHRFDRQNIPSPPPSGLDQHQLNQPTTNQPLAQPSPTPTDNQAPPNVNLTSNERVVPEQHASYSVPHVAPTMISNDSPLASGHTSHQTTSHATNCSMTESPVNQSTGGMSQADHFGSVPTPSSAILIDTRHYATRTSAFTVLPSHSPSTCPLDQILLDFLNSRREMLAGGADYNIVVGAQKPTVKALIDNTLVDSVHPLSRMLSEVLSTFPYVHQTEKFGLFFLMCLTMRWQICPTKENYLTLPKWLRPTVTQVTVPHAMWIDNIPWPGVRDILIENPEDYPFELFSEYYSQNVSLNWSFDSLDAVSDVGNDRILHSIFEKHIRNLKNWTVSSAFQTRFPSMMTSIDCME